VIVRGRERLVGASVHDARRRDVQHGDALDDGGMIQAKPMRDPATAVVPGDPKTREAERAHQLDLIARHRPLRIIGVTLAAVRLRRVAVAAQIAAHDGEALREARRDGVPHRVRLRVAVQQEQRRAAAADDAVDFSA
jgi:hypothetical protein